MDYQAIEKTEDSEDTAVDKQGSAEKVKTSKVVAIVAAVFFVVACLMLLVWQTRTEVEVSAPLLVEQPLSATELELRKDMQTLRESVESLQEQVAQHKDIQSAQEDLQIIVAQLSQSLQEAQDIWQRHKVVIDEIVPLVDSNTHSITVLKQQGKAEQARDKKQDSAGQGLLFQAPPFRLLTVEHWEGEPTAILELFGKTKAAQIGSYVALWKVVGINPLRQSIDVAYQNKLSHIRTLEAGS